MLLSVLAACGTPDSTDHTSRLLRGNGAEPESLDPHAVRSEAAGNILRDIGEGLVSFTADGRIVAGVAESWTISPDGLEYEFLLRPDARWSNGDPITADDFVYSFRRLADPGTAAFYASLLGAIVNAEAITRGEMPPERLAVTVLDDGRLHIRLKQATAYFLQLLSFPSTYPVHRDSVERYGTDFARPGRLLSNGAYRLQERVVGSHVKLTRNPFYWNDAQTRIDEVIFYALPDNMAELLRFRAGELDITSAIPAGSFARLNRDMPALLRVAPYLATYYLGFNLHREPFAGNRSLRRALSLAIDREVITQRVLGNGEQPAYSWTPPGINGYLPPPVGYEQWPPGQRLAEARRLYREAGYGPENGPEMELRFNTSEAHQRIAVAVQAMWKEALGLEVTLVQEEFRVMLQKIRGGQVNGLFRSSWIADYDDPLTFAEVLASDSATNMTGYNNPEYDSLLEKAAQEHNATKRYALLEKAEALAMEDVPLIPVYHYVSKHLVASRVGGWQDHALDYHMSKDLFLIPEGDGRQ